MDAALLSRLFGGLLAGFSAKSAAESLRAPFTLETFYHLLARLRRRLDAVRTLLCRETGPPECASADPIVQTLAHLNAAFSSAVPGGCDGDGAGMCAWFQMRFQRPFLG